MTEHVLHSAPETVHWGYFDARLEPKLRVRSGDTVTVHCVSGGPEILPEPPYQVLPEHRAIHAAHRPHLGRHILTGPVHVDGAMPGDSLEIEVLDIGFRTDWGWNLQRPLFGTLPEDFPFARRTVIPIDARRGVCTMPWGLEIPLRPFFGIMAVAPPPEWGAVSSVEPRAFGGNIDNKELGVGSKLFLPGFTERALPSAVGGHGVQGDGEVNLTALETNLSGTFRLTVHKGRRLTMPRAETPTHYITHGMDPDLDDAAKQALREMIVLICERTNVAPEDAYMLCSLACDLRVTQLVDGHKGIHAMIEKRYAGG